MAEKPKPQIDKFKEAAKQVGTDDREEAFNRAIKGVAKAPPVEPRRIQRGAKKPQPKPLGTG